MLLHLKKNTYVCSVPSVDLVKILTVQHGLREVVDRRLPRGAALALVVVFSLARGARLRVVLDPRVRHGATPAARLPNQTGVAVSAVRISEMTKLETLTTSGGFGAQTHYPCLEHLTARAGVASSKENVKRHCSEQYPWQLTPCFCRRRRTLRRSWRPT